MIAKNKGEDIMQAGPWETSGPPGETEEPETVEELTELEAARQQADEYLDQLQRTAAQFANYRKRIDREQAEFTKMANANLINRLLPVMDDLDRAFQTLPPKLGAMSWIEGLRLVQRKLQSVLEQEGVETIEAEGQLFDPLLHQAVTYEDADGYKEGQIIAELQKGYKLGDRVLRASMVRVAK